MPRKKRPPVRQEPHTERITILFSKGQTEVLDRYLRRHRIRSRSAFIRRCVMEHIVTEATKHRPTLFEEDENEGAGEEKR